MTEDIIVEKSPIGDLFRVTEGSVQYIMNQAKLEKFLQKRENEKQRQDQSLSKV